MANHAPVEIIIRGPHDTGRTTLASLLRMWLEENGYVDVVVRDQPPLPPDQKAPFQERFARNRERQIRIRVETSE